MQRYLPIILAILAGLAVWQFWLRRARAAEPNADMGIGTVLIFLLVGGALVIGILLGTQALLGH